jgi:hypothetical protein
MADALSTTLMGDHVNDVVEALSVSDVIPLCLGIAALFKNCLVGAFWQTGSTRNALIGDQQRHNGISLDWLWDWVEDFSRSVTHPRPPTRPFVSFHL